MTTDPLEAELRSLGHELATPVPPDDLAERVLRRLPTSPPRRTRSRGVRWLLGSRRRLVAIIVAAVVVALALTPPVRAAVVELLRIGGVIVRSAPAPSSTTASGAPTAGRVMSLAAARQAVDFELVIPSDLGPPDRVSVSPDLRVVGMDWGSGADRIHLDQFDGALSYAFVKKWWRELEMITVLERDAVWFDRPHEIVYTDAAGVEHTEDARLSGPALVFQRRGSTGDVTLRLEGRLTQSRAVTLAESVPR